MRAFHLQNTTPILDRNVITHHTDFSLLAGAGGADQGLQLISDPLVVIQDLRQFLHKVLRLARVWQIPYRHTELKADVYNE